MWLWRAKKLKRFVRVSLFWYPMGIISELWDGLHLPFIYFIPFTVAFSFAPATELSATLTVWWRVSVFWFSSQFSIHNIPCVWQNPVDDYTNGIGLHALYDRLSAYCVGASKLEVPRMLTTDSGSRHWIICVLSNSSSTAVWVIVTATCPELPGNELGAYLK